MSEHCSQYTGDAGADPPRGGIADEIRAFLAQSGKPVAIEPGCEPIPLVEGCFAIEERSGLLLLEAWDENRNLSRRITAVESRTRGRLALAVERFGHRKGILLIVDERAPRGGETERRFARLTFRERFRRALSRRFSGWRIETTMEADLEHSLSPSFPRALIRKGQTGWAAIGADQDPDAVLTFGLIWLDYLRSRERRLAIEGLLLYLPAGRERTTCLRLRWLNPRAAKYSVLAFTPDGYEDEVDLDDYGNLQTEVEQCRKHPAWSPEVERCVSLIAAVPEVECVPRGDGNLALRIRGLEFARATPDRLLWGIDTKRAGRPAHVPEIVALARELARVRHPAASDHSNPLWRRNPEAWLESQVRANIREVDAALLPAPVYGQVPQFTGGERDIVDLLAAEPDGSLAVIELKASEDVHLPVQALDYWIRVRWHAERGDFGPAGYFRGVPLRTDPPRLLLVAPALAFHPTNEKVLRYMSPAVEIERVGVGLDWRSNLKVMFRYRS